ncbi:MAG: precorrin-6A reductase [Clostridiales bacterium]|nr:precorrin-6A reductase [Clostridiales bacterium]
MTDTKKRTTDAGKRERMGRRFLLFAGTTEGRELAEFLDERGIPALVCVATEYGEELLRQTAGIEVRVGRMEAAGMAALIRGEQPLAVLDATHPYADETTRNIRLAAKENRTAYYRLLRGEAKTEPGGGTVVFEDAASAARWLDGQQGNILLTTGIKELPVFAETIADRGRLYIRTLLQEEIFEKKTRYGLSGKQVICMQGPFSREMNEATIRMTGAKYLVTKESGGAGGFAEKVEAAKNCGAVCAVIRRPLQEAGYSAEEIRGIVEEKWQEYTELCFDAKETRCVTLLGIGMGSRENMTLEAVAACEEADCIIGAARMLDALRDFHKPNAVLYRPDEIAAYIGEYSEYGKIVVAFSGDVGFYSGAKRLPEYLGDEMQVRLIPGISTAAYFAARLRMPWEDMVLASSHGREPDLIGMVRQNEKVFTLASDAESIRKIAGKLLSYGFDTVKMYVGGDLSYPSEHIYEGTAADFAEFRGEGIFAAVIVNPRAHDEAVTCGIPDDAFLRGNVPMTKGEVRAVALAKLRLTRDAVVYDVGAGTGSVAVECARMADRGKVYAVEQKEEACGLITANQKKFAVDNIEIVPGQAPEALRDLSAPTHVFIGGSGGSLKETLAVISEKNPSVRIVLNCITLETLTEILAAARDLPLEVEDIASVTVAKARPAGRYHMMEGQNPVYVITMTGKGGIPCDTRAS